MWENDYCWVVTYKGTNILTQRRPTILTFKTKYQALKVFKKVSEKLKRTFPRLDWKEDVGNPNNNKIKSYTIEALTNSDIYIKAYKSKHTEIFGSETEEELKAKGID